MKLFLRSILFLVITSFGPLALGQTLIFWDPNISSGNYETPSNWLTDTVPGAGDVPLVVTTSTTPTITINQSSSPTVDNLFLYGNSYETGVNAFNGTIDYNLNSASTMTVSGNPTYVSALGVGYGGTVNFSGGTLQLTSGEIDIGFTPGTSGNGNATFHMLSGTLDASNSVIPLNIGAYSGISGTFTQSGTLASTVLVYQLNLGTNGGTGTYSITGSAANQLTLSLGGTVSIDNGTFTQNDAASTVDLSGSAGIDLGLTSGNVATYKLEAGILDTKSVILGFTNGSQGIINQSGGTLNSSGFFEIGHASGTGTYILSGGTANFQSGFTLGSVPGSTVTQSGSSTLTAGGPVTIGSVGTGTYALQSGSATFNGSVTVGGTGTINQSAGSSATYNSAVTMDGTINQSGGTATFNAGVTVGATGTITQSGGLLTITSGQELDLSATGAAYNLNGGILQVGHNGLNGSAGTLNFGGGTLQSLGGGTLQDQLSGTLSGNSTLDTTNGEIDLNGLLSGSGGLTVTGGGIVAFGQASQDTYTGPTIISNGTIESLVSLFPKNSNVSIGSSGVFDLFVNGSPNILNGSISGTGQLNLLYGGGGQLELTGPINFTGTTTIFGGGNLQIFNGTMGNIGQIFGAASLTIGGDPTNGPSTGTVNLAGTNTYNGITMVDFGFRLNTNNLDGALTVNNGATFGSGLTPLNLPSTPGNTVTLASTLTSAGTLVFNCNGSTADRFAVTGAADVTGTTAHVVGVGNLTNYKVLSSSALTTGLSLNTPLPTTVSGSGVLFSATVEQDPSNTNNLILNTVQKGTAAFAHTPNELAVSGSIDPILTSAAGSLSTGFVGLALALDNLPASQIAGALDELSPESLQYSRNIGIENSTFMAQQVNGFLSNLRNGYTGIDTSELTIVDPGFDNNLGRSLGSLLAYDPPSERGPAPNGVNYYPQGDSSSSSDSSSPISDSSNQTISDSPQDPLTTLAPTYVAAHYDESRPFNAFVGGNVTQADLNQSQSTLNAAPDKASYTAGSATFGVDYRVAANFAVGALINYNHTDASTDANGSKIKVDSYSPAICATYFKNGFYANGLAAYGINNYSNTRDISFAGVTAQSSPHGDQYVGDLDIGYDYQPEKHWIMGPTAGVTYTHLDIDSFTESGAGAADLTVNSQSVDSLRSRLGAHVIYQTHTGSVLLQPNITAMWQHEYQDNGSGITSQFNIPGVNAAPFTIQTASPSRDSALIGCGLTATLDNSMGIYLNYLADVGASDYLAQSIEAGFKARF